jgi:protein tyrosine phosphatase domain-containing protein 1
MLQDHSISGPWAFLVKEEVQCLCEGGRNCTHENPARQKAPNAIAGLHSSWVGDEVLAMARPWQENVLKHDVVSQFKQQNVGMILNLQEVRHSAALCAKYLNDPLLV